MARHRTSGMIRNLPDAGAIILVPTRDVGIEISRLILEMRGPEFDAKCETLVVERIEDLQKLRGQRRFLAADHTFDRFAGSDLFDYIRSWIATWNEKWRLHVAQIATRGGVNDPGIQGVKNDRESRILREVHHAPRQQRPGAGC